MYRMQLRHVNPLCLSTATIEFNLHCLSKRAEGVEGEGKERKDDIWPRESASYNAERARHLTRLGRAARWTGLNFTFIECEETSASRINSQINSIGSARSRDEYGLAHLLNRRAPRRRCDRFVAWPPGHSAEKRPRSRTISMYNLVDDNRGLPGERSTIVTMAVKTSNQRFHGCFRRIFLEFVRATATLVLWVVFFFFFLLYLKLKQTF